MAFTEREQLKALIDRLTDEEAQALWVIVKSMIWKEDDPTPEELEAIRKSEDIRNDELTPAEEVSKELGI